MHRQGSVSLQSIAEFLASLGLAREQVETYTRLLQSVGIDKVCQLRHTSETELHRIGIMRGHCRRIVGEFETIARLKKTPRIGPRGQSALLVHSPIFTPTSERAPSMGSEQFPNSLPEPTGAGPFSLSETPFVPQAAAELLGLKSEDFACFICMEFIFSPRTLPCGHNFCGHCLESWLEFNADFPCPLCRAPTGLKLVPPLNQMLMKLLLRLFSGRMSRSAQLAEERRREEEELEVEFTLTRHPANALLVRVHRSLPDSGFIDRSIQIAMLKAPRAEFCPVPLTPVALQLHCPVGPTYVSDLGFNVTAAGIQAHLMQLLQIKEGEWFLDAGTGSGCLASWGAVLAGPRGGVLALDNNPLAMQYTKRNIRTQVERAMAVPLPPMLNEHEAEAFVAAHGGDEVGGQWWRDSKEHWNNVIIRTPTSAQRDRSLWWVHNNCTLKGFVQPPEGNVTAGSPFHIRFLRVTQDEDRPKTIIDAILVAGKRHPRTARLRGYIVQTPSPHVVLREVAIYHDDPTGRYNFRSETPNQSSSTQNRDELTRPALRYMQYKLWFTEPSPPSPTKDDENLDPILQVRTPPCFQVRGHVEELPGGPVDSLEPVHISSLLLTPDSKTNDRMNAWISGDLTQWRLVFEADSRVADSLMRISCLECDVREFTQQLTNKSGTYLPPLRTLLGQPMAGVERRARHARDLPDIRGKPEGIPELAGAVFDCVFIGCEPTNEGELMCLRRLLRPGGRLVVPYQDQLLHIVRSDTAQPGDSDEYSSTTVMGVHFGLLESIPNPSDDAPSLLDQLRENSIILPGKQATTSAQELLQPVSPSHHHHSSSGSSSSRNNQHTDGIGSEYAAPKSLFTTCCCVEVASLSDALLDAAQILGSLPKLIPGKSILVRNLLPGAREKIECVHGLEMFESGAMGESEEHTAYSPLYLQTLQCIGVRLVCQCRKLLGYRVEETPWGIDGGRAWRGVCILAHDLLETRPTGTQFFQSIQPRGEDRLMCIQCKAVLGSRRDKLGTLRWIEPHHLTESSIVMNRLNEDGVETELVEVVLRKLPGGTVSINHVHCVECRRTVGWFMLSVHSPVSLPFFEWYVNRYGFLTSALSGMRTTNVANHALRRVLNAISFLSDEADPISLFDEDFERLGEEQPLEPLLGSFATGASFVTAATAAVSGSAEGIGEGRDANYPFRGIRISRLNITPQFQDPRFPASITLVAHMASTSDDEEETGERGQRPPPGGPPEGPPEGSVD